MSERIETILRVLEDDLASRLPTTSPPAPPVSACDPQEARRCFHGRGHCYEGLSWLTIDWYAPVLLLTCFEAPEEAWFAQLIDQLVAWWEPRGLGCIVVQARYIHGAPSQVMWGTLPSECVAVEAGLRFRLMFAAQQNVGFFLDMRNVRQWLRQHCEHKRILNLFAYTCAFSVVALAANAAHVVNVDMSRTALQVGKQNHQLNQLSLRDVLFWDHDIFRSWGKIGRHGPYDLIILDPPSAQHGSFIATKDYPKLTRRLDGLLSETGQVIACLNSPHLPPEFLLEVFEEHAPTLQHQEIILPPETFPDVSPERGLKVHIYKRRT